MGSFTLSKMSHLSLFIFYWEAFQYPNLQLGLYLLTSAFSNTQFNHLPRP